MDCDIDFCGEEIPRGEPDVDAEQRQVARIATGVDVESVQDLESTWKSGPITPIDEDELGEGAEDEDLESEALIGWHPIEEPFLDCRDIVWIRIARERFGRRAHVVGLEYAEPVLAGESKCALAIAEALNEIFKVSDDSDLVHILRGKRAHLRSEKVKRIWLREDGLAYPLSELF